MCGAVDYEAFFDGQLISPTSHPMSYDTLSRTFEINSEDEGLLGARTIEVRGYLRYYPTVTSAIPNLTTTIEIVDACNAPNLKVDTISQPNLPTYNYSVEGLQVETSLISEPSFCPVAYECVAVIEANVRISCDEGDLFKVDSETGSVEVQTSDM